MAVITIGENLDDLKVILDAKIALSLTKKASIATLQAEDAVLGTEIALLKEEFLVQTSQKTEPEIATVLKYDEDTFAVTKEVVV